MNKLSKWTNSLKTICHKVYVLRELESWSKKKPCKGALLSKIY